VVYVSGDAIVVSDLDGHSRTIAREATGRIWSLAPSPDGSEVLYLHIDHDVDATFRLKRVGVEGGPPEIVRVFGQSLGRGASSEDEVSVAWSPDGESILAVNTHEYSEEYQNGSIYLLAPDGSITAQWAGTHPRWSPDSGTIYYREHGGDDRRQRWHAMDVATMRSRLTWIRPSTNSLTVSPNGRWVSYDTAWFGDTPGAGTYLNGAPIVYAFDLVAGVERRLQRGAVGALWIANRDVLVTDAKGDPPNCWCSWQELGTVTRLTLGGDAKRVNLPSTAQDRAVDLGS
jgi:hypothetical protein